MADLRRVGKLAIALASFTAEGEGELGFEQGAELTILPEDAGEGWLVGLRWTLAWETCPLVEEV